MNQRPIKLFNLRYKGLCRQCGNVFPFSSATNPFPAYCGTNVFRRFFLSPDVDMMYIPLFHGPYFEVSMHKMTALKLRDLLWGEHGYENCVIHFKVVCDINPLHTFRWMHGCRGDQNCFPCPCSWCPSIQVNLCCSYMQANEWKLGEIKVRDPTLFIHSIYPTKVVAG